MLNKREEQLSRAMKLFICTERLHHSVFDRNAAQFGLHRSQHRMLMFLCKGDRTVSQKELAEAMEISPAAVTVAIKRLEEDGYVVRIDSEKDSRVNEIYVTEKAKKLASESRRVFKNIDDTMFETLSDTELTQFIACLEKMQASLKNMEVAK